MALISPEQMATVDTIGAAMRFIKMDIAGGCARALLAGLGATSDTPIALLATIPESIWNDTVAAVGYKVDDQDRTPTPIERGQMAMLKT